MCAKPLRNAFEAYLAPKAPGQEIANARRLPLARIDPNEQQARQVFDETALAELADSIRQHDVLQPIGVVPVGERYRILFGERRYRAAYAAGKTDIPALIYADLSAADAAILTALENLQREDLDPEDEARQFAHLLDVTGLSQRKLAERLGIDHTYLARRVKMLEERPDLFERVRKEEITWRQALAVLHGATLAEVVSGVTPAAEEATEVLHGATPADRTARAEMPNPRDAACWRDLIRAYRALGKIQAEAIPLAECADLEQQLADLETQVATTRRAIQARLAVTAPSA